MPKTTIDSSLLGRGTPPEQLRAALDRASELACRAIYGAGRHVRPAHEADPDSPRPRDVDLTRPLGSVDAALEELRPLWLDRAVYYHHEAYLSHLNCPVATPAVAAEILATSLNTAVESWDQAGPAAEMEQHLIRWIAGRLGLPGSANGVFTSGGSQSNLQALAVARNKARAWAAPGATLAVFASPSAHYSVRRAADLLGLRPEAVVSVETTDDGAMDPGALAAAIDRSRNAGWVPAAVIATAGTTDRGIIDPLGEIARVAHRAGAHLHVDAAYGGVACLSPRHAHRLNGIESADSVTVDFHKTFYQPLACSAVLVADAGDLSFISENAQYLNPADEPRLNLADYSLQTSRRFDALKLWVTLRTIGQDAIGDAFDRCVATAREVAEAIDADPQFELYEKPQLTTVLFSLAGDAEGRCCGPVRDALHDSGTAAIAVTRIRGRSLMKFTLLDPTLTVDEVTAVLAEIADAARHLHVYTTS